MAKAWLDVQVDLELTRLQPNGLDQLKIFENAISKSPSQEDTGGQTSFGPENWPLQVLNQQPSQLSALLQKLHSRYIHKNADFNHITLFSLGFLYIHNI